jgi:hypothetical protein
MQGARARAGAVGFSACQSIRNATSLSSSEAKQKKDPRTACNDAPGVVLCYVLFVLFQARKTRAHAVILHPELHPFARFLQRFKALPGHPKS